MTEQTVPPPREPATGGSGAWKAVNSFPWNYLTVALGLGIVGAVVGTIVHSNMRPPPADATAAQMRSIEDAINHYRLEARRLPVALGELVGPNGVLGDVPVPTDAWGNEFVYSVTGPRSYALVSLGADGRPGGEDEDADIRRKKGWRAAQNR